MSRTLKNVLLGVLAAVLLFVPTYIALISYRTSGNWRSMLTGSGTALTVKSTEGQVLFAGSAGDAHNSAMTERLAGMMTAGQVVHETPEEGQSEIFEAVAQMPGRSRTYKLYYTSTDRSYLEDVTAGVMYAVGSSDMLGFLQEFFYAKSDEELHLPVLRAGETAVSPTYLHWSHKTDSGFLGDVPERTYADEEVTYEVGKNISFSFDETPDEATLRVVSGAETLYDGKLADFTGLKLSDSTTLKVVLQAKWAERADRPYCGEIGYSFYLNYKATPTFSISTTSATIGEYLVLSVKDVPSALGVTVTSEPSMGVTPMFYEDDDYMRAIVPLSMSLSGGTYRLTVRVGDAEQSFDVQLEERSTLSRTYEADKALINKAHSAAALAEYAELLESIGSSRSGKIYFDGAFIDYYRNLASDDINVTLKLGFGHYRTLSVTKEKYQMDGVDFVITSNSSSSGVALPVLNAGRVDYVGSCAYLGNFVVVDHGMGLRTWYCHLSETSVRTGTVLAKGDVIGKTGSTGFTTDPGVYLICTVGTTPISPYYLWDFGVKF